MYLKQVIIDNVFRKCIGKYEKPMYISQIYDTIKVTTTNFMQSEENTI